MERLKLKNLKRWMLIKLIKLSNRFAGSENLNVSVNRNIDWGTVTQHIDISAKEKLRHVNEVILNHILLKIFQNL
jgi:hypothetical protein